MAKPPRDGKTPNPARFTEEIFAENWDNNELFAEFVKLRRLRVIWRYVAISPAVAIADEDREQYAIKQAKAGDFHELSFLARMEEFKLSPEARSLIAASLELLDDILKGERPLPKRKNKRPPKPDVDRAALSVMVDAEMAYAEIFAFMKWQCPSLPDSEISTKAFELAANEFGIRAPERKSKRKGIRSDSTPGDALRTYWNRRPNDRHRLSPRPEIPEYPKTEK